MPSTQATGGHFSPASRNTPPTCRQALAGAHTLIHATSTRTELIHSHTDTLSLVRMQMTPSPPAQPLTHPGAHGGASCIFSPSAPSPRLGGVSAPLPGRHMWFQLTGERAFPSQTARPCQGPGPTGARKKGHLHPHSATDHPRDPEVPSPWKALFSFPLVAPSPVAGHHTLRRSNWLCPGLCPRLPGCPLPARLLLTRALS